MINTFGPDALDEDGKAYWSGVKRFPQIITYDPEDAYSLSFVASAANILAYSFGLDYCHDLETIKKLSLNVKLPKYELKKIEISEDNNKTEPINYGEEEEMRIAFLSEKLKSKQLI